MSATEDYASNIDDQLLNVKGDDADSDVERVKLEQIAHAAAVSASSLGTKKQPYKQRKKDLGSDGLKSFHELQQQHEQQHQQQQHHQQQLAAAAAAAAVASGALHHHNPHQQLSQHQNHLAELTGGDGVELSEYNIQIPEPMVDEKLRKIYPVNENTITADGNLITRPYPEQIFHSREGLNDFILEFARDNGFGVVIAHSNKKAIYYTCELGGRYRHKKSKKETIEEARQVEEGYLIDPNVRTKKLKCPFSMTASYKKSTNIWTLRTTCNEHNHPQLDPMSNHPMLRKRSDELNLLILDLYKVGTKPSHIESKIKEQYPDVLIKREDIYNEIRGYKRKLKKQSARLGMMNPASRIAGHKRRALAAAEATLAAAASGQGVNHHDDAAAVAAVAAAASANAFLHNDDNSEVLRYDLNHHTQHQQQHHIQSHKSQNQVEHQQQHHHQVSQHQHQHQHLQEDFQRQLNEASAAAAVIQYQNQLGLNESDSAAAGSILDVANAAVREHYRETARQYNESGDLSMDNIDSRLVGE